METASRPNLHFPAQLVNPRIIQLPPTGPFARAFFVFFSGHLRVGPLRVVSFPTPPAGNRLRSWRRAGRERLRRSSVICEELWNGSAKPSSPRL
jgi:hypothetical protein